jgi:hypothetical protein
MRRSLALVLAALTLAACSPDFAPASKVEKLRVLAIQAEPPEIDPAGIQTAALTSLVLRADDVPTPSRVTSVLHVACLPNPGNLSRPSPCVGLSQLADAIDFIRAAAPASCGPVPRPLPVFAGVEACRGGVCGPAALSGGGALPDAAITVEPTYWASLPPAAPERILGVQAVDLAFAVDATPDELAAPAGGLCANADLVTNLADLWGAREHVLSIKRVVIHGPDSPDAPNRNPAVAGILAGSTALLDPAAATTLAPGVFELAPVLPAGSAGAPEVYTKRDAAGAPLETAPEDWVYSWFSNAGELKDLNTRGSDTDRWTLVGQGPAKVVVVVRDLRGGTAWAVRDVMVAP